MFDQDVQLFDLPNQQLALAEALQFQLGQSQKLPAERFNIAQLTAIKVLLKHSVSSVPFYHKNDLYKDVNTWEDFRQLPVITREKIQQYQQELISKDELKGHGKNIEFRSSGSTGTPIHALSTDRAQFYWRGITLRDHLWHDRDFSKTLAVVKNLSAEDGRYPGIKNPVWGPSTSAIFSTGPSIILNSSETIDVQYQWLVENQPEYLLTYPSSLHELTKLHLKEKKSLNLKGISTLGESLGDSTRELVKEAFGCSIKDMYSAQEVGYMALQCPKHDHYHIQSEVCLVEILDEDNQPCAPGQLGRVVVTPLHNFRMPLIRYAIGDYAIAGDQCDCGIQLPTIKKIIGRTRNLVIYPDGRKSWPAYNPMALMKLMPNCQFQLVQTSANDITLNVVGDLDLTDSVKRKAKKIIIDAIGHPFEITIIKQEIIQRSSSGKFEEFICKIESA